MLRIEIKKKKKKVVASVTYFINFRKLNDHLFGKELFIRFTASAFRKLPSIYVFSYFPFGFEGRKWDLIVSVPDYCLSFYFESRTPVTTIAPTNYVCKIESRFYIIRYSR